jgi:formylglycine-generating enzyme required for sulfatase activity
MNADGSDQRQLTSGGTAAYPAWSPDGARIAFHRHQSDAVWSIYVIDADGRNLQRLTTSETRDANPVWSPDGSQIAFSRDGDMWVMNVDGGEQRLLMSDPVSSCCIDWSPDGSRIAFESERDGNAEIYVVQADGSNPQRLTDDEAQDWWPAWSPDNTQIAFMSDRDGDWEIYVMDADGGNLRQLTNNDADDSGPAWSPDGARIVFHSDRDGGPGYDTEIYIMNADGSHQQRITRQAGMDWGPNWRPIPAPVSRTRPADGMVMHYVSGGEFDMGSSEAEIAAALAQCEAAQVGSHCERRDYNEFPVHAVTLEGFWLDRTEVTNAQYALCVEDGACRPSRLAGNATYNGDDYPVAGIPWQDAADYCAWAGARLPTEAEWEYAARGAERRIYPWGNAFDCEGGNFENSFTGCDDGYAHTAPVGSFLAGASWCGVLDMAGNVWEWVADWYGDYPSAPGANPTGPASGDLKILRGGSWGYDADGVRAAYRYSVSPDADYLGVGLRCAVSATTP